MDIGFIGLGVMGMPMATHLVEKSGCTVHVFDLDKEKVKEIESLGAVAEDTAEAMMKACEVVMFILPMPAIVKTYVDLAINNCKPGTIVVDLSTSDPVILQEAEKDALAKGITLIDSPVSGGTAGANAGNLSVMVGGDETAFEKVKPILSCFGASVIHMGKLGSGYITKFANNMIVGCNLVGTIEAVGYAEKAGIDARKFYEATHLGAVSSFEFDFKIGRLESKDYTNPDDTVKVHLKDQHLAIDYGKQMGAYTPVVEIVTELMEKMNEAGRVMEDVACVRDLFD